MQDRQLYFSAAGYNNYVRSFPVFFQDLIDVEQTNPEAYGRSKNSFCTDENGIGTPI